jgi:hypothetical protein
MLCERRRQNLGNAHEPARVQPKLTTQRPLECRVPARLGAPLGSFAREAAFGQHDISGAYVCDEPAGKPPCDEGVCPCGDGCVRCGLRARRAGTALMDVDAHGAARRRIEPYALQRERRNHGDARGAWQILSCGAPELGRHHETSVAAP